MLEKKTICGSWVTEKMAGMESKAKIMSENSIIISTTKSGVHSQRPSTFVKKLCPSNEGVLNFLLVRNFTTG